MKGGCRDGLTVGISLRLVCRWGYFGVVVGGRKCVFPWEKCGSATVWIEEGVYVMRWVKARDRQPEVSDGDICGEVVCRRLEESERTGRMSWAVFIWQPELDGLLDPCDWWLEGAFEDVGEVRG